MALLDSHGRKLTYLRLSLLDKCNFRCFYCQPYEHHSEAHRASALNTVEIKNLSQALGLLGVKKIRLTGGEPTLRPDIVEIVSTLSDLGYFDKIALSTNAFALKDLAPKLKNAGLDAVNISLDALQRDKFIEATGMDKLHEVKEGIAAALAAGIATIKVNAVLMKGINDGDLQSFLALVKDAPISMRFIEFMRTGNNADHYAKFFVSTDLFRAQLELMGWMEVPKGFGDGPAKVFSHPDYIGTMGFISPYSRKFCTDCNRLRIDSRGRLRMCLFGKMDYDLRQFMQQEDMIPLLQQHIIELINFKPKEHFLDKNDPGDTKNLLSIGG